MKRWFQSLLLVGLATAFMLPESVVAAPSTDDLKRETSVGVRAAESLSQVTGIAISPLLGVGAMGAYKYYRTRPEDRSRLSWYARPWFWSVALAIVGICLLKDSLGPAIPTSLKKPLDLLELFENKLSAIIATGVIIPIAAEVFEAMKPHTSTQLNLAGFHFAVAGLNSFGDLIMIPLALMIYAVVWLVSHTVNVLILVSPFTTVDTVLKSFRTAVLGSVVGTQVLNSGLGAAWALVVVLISLLLAPWAFRTVVFGTVFAWDLVSFRRKRFTPDASGIRMFVAARVGQAPRRTFGTLSRNGEDRLVFTWRPWLVLPARIEVLPPGSYIIGRGVIFSEILRLEGERATDIFSLPPRCNGHEEALACIYGFPEIRPVGLRAGWAWLKALFVQVPATG